MAIDEGLVELLREDLTSEADLGQLSEQRMFGGLCFMLNGHMLCGVHKNGGMFRVGKELEPEALATEGSRRMDFTSRPMPGFIDVSDDLMADDARRLKLLNLAKTYVGAMAPK
jgi:TfoX/Sxy family transcriptional regulator of competence genes